MVGKRRSQRANKGVPPTRFAPAGAAVPESASAHTTATDRVTEPERVMLPDQMPSTSMGGATTGAMPHSRSPSPTSQPPPPDQADRFMGRSAGLPLLEATGETPCLQGLSVASLAGQPDTASHGTAASYASSVERVDTLRDMIQRDLLALRAEHQLRQQQDTLLFEERQRQLMLQFEAMGVRSHDTFHTAVPSNSASSERSGDSSSDLLGFSPQSARSMDMRSRATAEQPTTTERAAGQTPNVFTHTTVISPPSYLQPLAPNTEPFATSSVPLPAHVPAPVTNTSSPPMTAFDSNATHLRAPMWQMAAPVLGQMVPPVSGQMAAPVSGRMAAPVSGRMVAPVSGQMTTPMGSLPTGHSFVSNAVRFADPTMQLAAPGSTQMPMGAHPSRQAFVPNAVRYAAPSTAPGSTQMIGPGPMPMGPSLVNHGYRPNAEAYDNTMRTGPYGQQVYYGVSANGMPMVNVYTPYQHSQSVATQPPNAMQYSLQPAHLNQPRPPPTQPPPPTTQPLPPPVVSATPGRPASQAPLPMSAAYSQQPAVEQMVNAGTTYCRQPPGGVDTSQPSASMMTSSRPIHVRDSSTGQAQQPGPAGPISDYYVNTYRAANDEVNEAASGSTPTTRAVYSGDGNQPVRNVLLPPPDRFPPARQCGRYRRVLQDLPTFGGAPEEWPHFICLFEESTREFELTPLDNMGRLIKALVGDAKKRVKGILVRPEHVPRTMETLAKAFGKPGMLLESQLGDIAKMPKVSRLKDIVTFSTAVQAMVSFLDGPATRHILTNYTVLKDLESKLPGADQRKWASAARQIGDEVSVLDFANWLAGEADDIDNMKNRDAVDGPNARSETKPTPNNKRHVLLNVTGQASETVRCEYCMERHDITSCHAFKKLSVNNRFIEVRKRPLCFACLKPDHLLPGCTTATKCGNDGCEGRHHRLLHGATTWTQGASQTRNGGDQTSAARRPNRIPPQKPKQQNSASAKPVEDRPQSAVGTETRQASAVLSCQDGRTRQTLYYRVVPVELHGPNVSIRTHALMDEGSSVSLLDAELATQLELDGVEESLDLQFVSGVSSKQSSKKVAFDISAVSDGAPRFRIAAVQTSRNLSLPMQRIERAELLRDNPHLREVPFTEFADVRPQLLLGLEHYHLGVAKETRVGDGPPGIAAARTDLGWVLYGCGGRPSLPGAVVLHARRPDKESCEDSKRLEMLHELVRQHFTTDDFGVRLPTAPIRSDADDRAFATMEATTRRTGTRFETGLLWKRDGVELPASREMALNRLRSVEAKMRRDPNYSRQYREQMQAYIEKGYARMMSPEEAAQTVAHTWYLPHFAVLHASKPGKFRLVFDAAASVKNVCLNDVLMSGPDLNVPLARLLFRLRMGQVAVAADIKEMFHQVQIRKEDQDAQRFLWRDGDSKAEPKDYVMVAMTFGATCSPTLAQYVKNRNAQDFADEFPEAAVAVQTQHYVDDFVASFRTAEEAARVTAQVIEVHKRGGFDLRGVVSNCPTVQAQFEISVGASSAVRLEPKDPTQKILGMVWETSDDTFTFHTRFHRVDARVLDGSRKPTKREMLSFVMSIFDPFGLLADFLLPSKCMLQELWRLGVEWDEQIPDSIDARWQEWRIQVEQTRNVRVPRCYSSDFLEPANLQLHIFADASEEAFATVAYWRITGKDGVELAFVAGKSRCSPLKLLSIPRLELQAAVLAARLTSEIRASHSDQRIERVVFWTDSETVLKWLRCDRRRYAPFVAHRVAEVVESAPADQWRWVPTALNVADDATRVRKPIAFNPKSRWLLGPTWLREDEASWPQQPEHLDAKDATSEELRPKFVGVVTSKRGAVHFDRFSKWTRLTRCVAWVRRFIHRAQGRGSSGELTAEEVEEAERAVCRLVQLEVYGEDVETLRADQSIASSSRLFILKPYLDEEGVLRLHGRTDAARPEFLSSSAKRPIIMPETHHATMLITRHYHERMAHQLTQATMTAVRVKFWVPKLRALVTRVGKACQRCRVRAAVPKPPTQGQLPSDRLNAYARPFTNTGVDFFGPYHVTVGRRHEKRWAALFTCMAVRAVHIEVAADLSTDAFIVCLRNFCHLRGTPAMIRCDNGTNFVGARNELERDGKFVDAEAVQKELAVKGIQWRFNCPYNPEAGGAWERLVQATKKVLSVTLHEEAPHVETFRAVLLEAANIINSRPLTHLQVDPDDPEPITPNHFLFGGPNVATAPNPDDVEPKATRRQWRICRGLSRRFWTQFVDEYLPELTRRSKHYPEEPPLKVTDLVIICDPQQPRGRWARGVVVEVATGGDGVVRTATVKTAAGVCRRPVTRLARLEIGPPNEDGVRGAVSATSLSG